VIFEDNIKINCKAVQAFEFFQRMEENYLNWHHEHVVFKWVKGLELIEGNVFYFEEKIGNELLKKEVRLSKVVPNKYIEFQPTNRLLRFFLPKMTFIIEEQDIGILFTAQIFLDWFGPLARRLQKRQFNAIRQHMKEEGENLKIILEL